MGLVSEVLRLKEDANIVWGTSYLSNSYDQAIGRRTATELNGGNPMKWSDCNDVAVNAASG
jgi:hypothetical protein